ncbi:DUF1707 SHOCT-like domain-containing protein [Longispora albida]|uniref:DUF1707 SHOCT-like domain-containing protein n=1 Tax=Longispora albida TaxID=203523 RepID=UPI00037B82B9|nr:DUF1707 domain-containing protein [Longispora albida]
MDHENTPDIRVSDADRSAVAERLRIALSEGRLDLNEYERRFDLSLRAVVQSELVPLTADLPAPVVSAEVARKESDRKAWMNEWRTWAGTAVILTAIWGVSSFASGEFRYFWPIWPLGIWGAWILAAAIMPGSDKDHGRKKKR